MIAVQLNRADFEYDIHSLVKAFSVGRGICGDGGKRDERGNIVSYCYGLSGGRHRHPVFARKKTAGKQTLRQVTSGFSNRKETKNRLKRAYYQMLCEYTGRTLPWGSLTGIRPVRIPLTFLEEEKTRRLSAVI